MPGLEERVSSRRWPSVLTAASALLAIVAIGAPRVWHRVRLFNEALDIRGRIVYRLNADVALIRAELETASITASQHGTLRARLVDASGGIASIPRPDLTHFTTVLPLNSAHAAILAVHGGMLAATGLPPAVVWKIHRYDAVPLLAVPPPPGDAVPSVDIVVMSHEYRADSFLLTNATSDPDQGGLVISDVPGAPRPDWLGVSGVEWTDTRQAVPVADALPDAICRRGVPSHPASRDDSRGVADSG